MKRAVGVRIGSRMIRIVEQAQPPDKCGVAKQVATYRVQFPGRAFLSDSLGEVRCLQAIAQRLLVAEQPTVLETSSRVGITVPVWLEDLNAGKLILNDLNPSLVEQLRGNFPEAAVFMEDVTGWVWPPADVVYADMNTFTLRKLDSWDFMFRQAAESSGLGWFVFVDSCCYGFNFGRRASYLRYGPTEDHYWMALRNALWDRYGLGIQFGSRANRATILAASHQESDGIEWLDQGNKRVELVYEGQLF